MPARGFAVVLPARYHSSRFPGKPLAILAGRPLIEWVYRRAERIPGAAMVVVATDHDQIAAVVEGFGGNVIMTSRDHRTGTDRVAEVARSLDHDCIVNLQGDEPVFPPRLVQDMVAVLDRSADIDIVTACHALTDTSLVDNPNVVKVVMDRNGGALYFSRSPIPFGVWDRRDGAAKFHRHVGVYAFRRAALLRFADTPPTPLEVAEGLEQLRALESGMTIRVLETEELTVGVDVPEDIKNVEKELSSS